MKRFGQRGATASVVAVVVAMGLAGCGGDTSQQTPATAAPGPTAPPADHPWHVAASSLVAFSTESTAAVFDTLPLADPVEFAFADQPPFPVAAIALSEPSAWTIETPNGPLNILELIAGGAVDSGIGETPACDGDATAGHVSATSGVESTQAIHAWIVPAQAESCATWSSVGLDIVDDVISRVTLTVP
ncbi:MAG: hypothetical protein GX868_01115 [Actinobacteria bacterium]|nr:hypothetical protein [Actinomycetota bacterium]